MSTYSDFLPRLESDLEKRVQEVTASDPECQRLRAAISALRILIEDLPTPVTAQRPPARSLRPKTGDRSPKAAVKSGLATSTELLEVLRNGPLKTAQIAFALGVSHPTAMKRLQKQLKAGTVKQSGWSWLLASAPKEAVHGRSGTATSGRAGESARV
jgi:hypothetical protein